MDDEQSSLSNLDTKLFQLVAQTRKLFQTKNEIYEQIKVCRADIDDTKSFTETTKRNINKLEEEISVKQNIVRHNKATVKSMRASQSQLLQYDKTLKAEVERREASYNQDVEVYDERITNYWKVFQEHKEYYHQRPLAEKLLTRQAENEAIECRINACEDQIAIKQRELDGLVGQTVISSSTEKPPDRYPSEDPHCDSGELTITAPEKQLDHQTEMETEISSLNLSQIKISQNGHKMSGEANAEEVQENSKAQDTPSYPAAAEEASHELFSHPQSHEQKQQSDQMAFADRDQESTQEEQEEAAIISDIDEAAEEEREDGVAVEEEQALLSTDEEDNKGHGALPQSSPRASPLSSPARIKDMFSTPTFSLGCSPSSSPSKRTSEVKSPASLFSMKSGPSPTGFSRFGFDMGSTQEEESPFTFASSYFSDKKTSESKSPSGTGFLFEQTDKCEDFQFSFTSKSPQTSTADQDKTSRDEFPFSFNFGKF